MSQAFKNVYALLISMDESSAPVCALSVAAKNFVALTFVIQLGG